MANAKPAPASSAEIRFEVRTLIQGKLTPERITFAQIALEMAAAKAVMACPDLAMLDIKAVSHQIVEPSPEDGNPAQSLRKA